MKNNISFHISNSDSIHIVPTSRWPLLCYLALPLGQSSTPKPALTTVQTFWMRHRSIQKWYCGSLNKRHHKNKQRHNNEHFHNNERENKTNNHTTSFQAWRAVSTTAVQSRTVTPLSLTRGLGPGHQYHCWWLVPVDPADAWWLVQVNLTKIGDWSLMLIVENLLFRDRLQSLKLCWSQRGRQLLHVWLRGI